ncbi:DUF502 domain-containing protein [Kiloniella laminariae]|uniref:DUF502 domain-containing protein n=1 Tax=Kiloniella laminariae TaxID=454162 RepID=A0ABT4LND9_9PROT|nr:DUF502 domain-containing protein [Kiloniella laminariae]MCZ4282603.1 DUF502 domain-containing protein [Kiloniella laminariae]
MKDKGRKAKKKLKLSVAQRLSNYLLAGVLITAPVTITLWLAWKAITFVDRQVTPYIPSQWNPESYLPFGVPGLGLLVIVVGLTLIGFLTAGYIGRLLMMVSENLVKRLPVVRSIYSWTKQVFETVLSQKSGAFREVVLVEYPCKGSWAVGFITGRTKGEVQGVTEESVINVFVPATPNPTTGFLLFIPEQDVHHLDMTVEEGIKLVISGGILTPSDIKKMSAENKEAKPATEETHGHRPGLLMRLRNYFFAGMLVTAPIGLTFWLAWEIVVLIDSWVRPYIPAQWNPETYVSFAVPGFGLFFIFLGLTLIGFLTAGIVGKTLLRISERMLDQMPVIRTLYGAIKQIIETIFQKHSNAFREVVLIEYPRPGSWALGFYTGDSHPQIRDISEDESINVFLPTTPNPTSGFLLFVPRGKTKSLTMTVEEGIKMVVSGGIVTPEDRRKKEGQQVSASGKPGKGMKSQKPDDIRKVAS